MRNAFNRSAARAIYSSSTTTQRSARPCSPSRIACAANCPSGVKALDIFLKARAILTGYLGLSKVKQVIFRGMLTKSGLLNTLLGVASKIQGLFTTPVNDISGSSCSKFLSPVLGDRHLMLLAKTPLHSEVPSLDTPAGKSGLRVALFPGCLADKIFPRVGHAVLKVLGHHGVGVHLPAAWPAAASRRCPRATGRAMRSSCASTWTCSLAAGSTPW